MASASAMDPGSPRTDTRASPMRTSGCGSAANTPPPGPVPLAYGRLVGGCPYRWHDLGQEEVERALSHVQLNVTGEKPQRYDVGCPLACVANQVLADFRWSPPQEHPSLAHGVRRRCLGGV